MTASQKWNPSNELERFRREVDDLLERFGFQRRVLGASDAGPIHPVVECFVDEDLFTLRADLPGVSLKDIEVTVAGGFVTIKGHREQTQESNTTQYYRRETRYGSFERTIQIPEGIEATELKATYDAGVLELTAKLPRTGAKRVKVLLPASEPKKPSAGSNAS
jgi:HSP20 family protein